MSKKQNAKQLSKSATANKNTQVIAANSARVFTDDKLAGAAVMNLAKYQDARAIRPEGEVDLVEKRATVVLHTLGVHAAHNAGDMLSACRYLGIKRYSFNPSKALSDLGKKLQVYNLEEIPSIIAVNTVFSTDAYAAFDMLADRGVFGKTLCLECPLTEEFVSAANSDETVLFDNVSEHVVVVKLNPYYGLKKRPKAIGKFIILEDVECLFLDDGVIH